jgi:hypothetical protein
MAHAAGFSWFMTSVCGSPSPSTVMKQPVCGHEQSPNEMLASLGPASPPQPTPASANVASGEPTSNELPHAKDRGVKRRKARRTSTHGRRAGPPSRAMAEFSLGRHHCAGSAMPKTTKSKPANDAAGLPAAFSSAGEANKYLAKFKESLSKRFRLTKADALEEAVQLAWMLAAERRVDEALEICHHLERNIAFDGNYDRWAHAGAAIYLATRLHRERGDAAEAARLLERVREHDTNAVESKAEVARNAKYFDEQFADAVAETSQKWALQGAAFVSKGWCRWRETAGQAGFPHAALVQVAPVEAKIQMALTRMRDRLVR